MRIFLPKKMPCVLLALFTLLAPHFLEAKLSEQIDVQKFITDMSIKHGFEQAPLTSLINKATIRNDILRAISAPAETKPWYQYRPIFVTQARTDAGVDFYLKYSKDLARAEREYGVPASIIVAILGIETRYGTHKGSYSVLDSLATLAFAYPKRSDFFKSELEAYLLLTREEHLDPLTMTGSYAGAMGHPQFIASSYRNYAIDFSGDGKRDIINDPVDAIGSIANYFKAYGWKTGMPIAVTATATKNHYQQLVYQNDMKPKTLVKQWKDFGVVPSGEIADNIPATLITLSNKENNELWLGFDNFYVITRYNHSQLYAMAAYQLSQEINTARIARLAKDVHETET